jgi:hypothetical protein
MLGIIEKDSVFTDNDNDFSLCWISDLYVCSKDKEKYYSNRCVLAASNVSKDKALGEA